MILKHFILLYVFINYNEASINNIQLATGPPYLAHIVYDSPICLGSIVTDTSIITAKECIPNNSDFISRGKVLVGTRHEVEVQIKSVGYTLKDPEQNRRDFNNYDLAVITLRKPLEMSKSIQTIPLYQISEKTKSTKQIAYGYVVKGLNNPGRRSANSKSKLQFKAVQYMLGHGPVCDEFKAENNRIDAEEYCVGLNLTEKSDGKGMSMGAPILVDGKLFSVQTCCNDSTAKKKSRIQKKKILYSLARTVVEAARKRKEREYKKEIGHTRGEILPGKDRTSALKGILPTGISDVATPIATETGGGIGLIMKDPQTPIEVKVVVGAALLIVEAVIPLVREIAVCASAVLQVFDRIKSFFSWLFGK